MRNLLQRFIAHFLLILLGIAIGAMAAELFVRARRLAPELGWVELDTYRLSKNSLIGFEPDPTAMANRKDTYDRWLGIHVVHGKRNSLGYRDEEHALVKKPGDYRIVIIGDSLIAGWAIQNDLETFPAQLQHALRSMGKPVEVINFGVAGYNTEHEVETLKDKGLAYKPDLVILSYCYNDYEGSSDILRQLLMRAHQSRLMAPSAMKSFFMKSALLRYLVHGPPQKLWNKPKPKEDDTSWAMERYKIASQDRRKEYFAELAQLSKKEHFDVLVIVFPYAEEKMIYAEAKEQTAVENFTNENNLTRLDLLPAFQDCQNNSASPVFFHRMHPNSAGYLCAAKTVADFVSNKYLVKFNSN